MRTDLDGAIATVVAGILACGVIVIVVVWYIWTSVVHLTGCP